MGSKVTERPNIHDVWKLPFHSAKFGPYIWSANTTMVFTWMIKDKLSRDLVLETLNGERDPSGNFEARLVRDIYVVVKEKSSGNETTLGMVRGWGNLHGSGGLNLDMEVAEKVHEEFCQWIVDRLNGKV